MSESTISLPTNFGMWAGPAYAGGTIFGSTTDQDGRLFFSLYDENSATYVQPRGYLDAAARNHDLAYEYAARAYGGPDPKKPTEMQKQAQFLADLDLMANALQYRPVDGDFIGKQYRDMIIKGFYYVAVREYGFSAHMPRLWKDYLQKFDPGYVQPNISNTPVFGNLTLIGAIPDVVTAMAWGQSGMEALATSDFVSKGNDSKQGAFGKDGGSIGLTQQEMMLFNQHLSSSWIGPKSGKPDWEYGGDLAGGGPVSMVSNLAIPKYDIANNAFVFVGHLGDEKITMTLENVNDPTRRNFIKLSELNGVTTRIRWNTNDAPDKYGNRSYKTTTEILQADGSWLRQGGEEVLPTPTLPELRVGYAPFLRWETQVRSLSWPAGNDAVDKLSFQNILSDYPTPTNYSLEDLLEKGSTQRYPTADSLLAAALAPEGIAMRFALLRLEPFIRKGGSFSTLNANGELDLFDSASGKGQMSKEYLADRAVLLFQIMHFPKSIETYATRFEDAFFKFNYGSPTAAKMVLFGNDAADTLTAGTGDSHLYGGAGNDTLNGGGGADYLEGNSGSDVLVGG
ncbi:MAG: hypothetical protein NTY05_07415, partial [Rhodocyclales bacterium]|nr:hypothetical protein [Rhodocyclales bacterium]